MAEDSKIVTPDPPKSDARLTFEERGRNFIVLRILPSEIRQIGSFQNSESLAFFTLMLGLAIGFGSTVILSYDTLGNWRFALFTALTFASVVLTLFFGWRARRDKRNCDSRIDDIINKRDADI